MNGSLQVLALAPYCDGMDVGEAWCSHQWVKHLSHLANVTLLTLRQPGQIPSSVQLPEVEVIEWNEKLSVPHLKRLSSMLKPSYIHFYYQAHCWLNAAFKNGRKFDIAHQFSPGALRYPSPLAGFSIPYVMGPQAGSLDTPQGFVAECGSSAWYTRLRGLDTWRIQHDPMLHRTYHNAAVILGVAPYVGEIVAPMMPRRFEVISELGIDNLVSPRCRRRKNNSLKLVHVGRAIRTKGLRDAVRAFAQLPDTVKAHLDVAGQGEELELCRSEARHLGVERKITFHGQIPRAGVEDLYANADVFLFPSFREPSGSVVFEALRHSLPVITTDRGGPGFVIDHSCGITVSAINPDQLSRDLALSISKLTRDQSLCEKLSIGAYKRIRQIGLWRNKIKWLLNLYQELIEDAGHPNIKEVL